MNKDNERETGDVLDAATDVITLVDDEGVEHEFEIVDSAEFEGENYMALVPVFDDPQDMLDDSGELVILKIVAEEGDEYLEAIEDEAEFDKVGAFFMERLSDVFDFEE